MFSYHVHEKTILLASIPMCLLSFSETDQVILKIILPWILTISTFSMTPLLIKDGLLIPTISLSALYLTVISNIDNLATIGMRYVVHINKFLYRLIINYFFKKLFQDKIPDLIPDPTLQYQRIPIHGFRQALKYCPQHQLQAAV